MESWAKMSSSLDSNPKIRKGGREAREVFLFALRRNAELDLGGRIPAIHLEDEYVAEQLMMTKDEAASGLSRCVRTGLLSQDGDFFVIDGWADQWAKRPLTEAERKQRQRAKSKTSNKDTDHVTNMSGQGRDSLDSHASEESREEKSIDTSSKLDTSESDRKKNKKPKEPPPEGFTGVVDAFHARFLSKYGTKPTWGAKQGSQVKALLKSHGAPEVTRRIAVLFDSPPSWLSGPFDLGTLVMHFDKLVGRPQPAQTPMQAEPPLRRFLDDDGTEYWA